MSEHAPYPEVAVFVRDLEIIRAALNSAHHQNMVLDLADQYRRLGHSPKPSKLSLALEQAVEMVDASIESGTPDEDEPNE